MKLKALLSLALIVLVVAGCTAPPNGTAIVLQYPDDAALDEGMPPEDEGSRGVGTTTVRALRVINDTTVGGTLTVEGGVTGANVLTTGDQTAAGIKTWSDAAIFSGATSAAGLVTGTAGATISGAAVNLNASSNFATNINTGTTNAALTLGGGSGTVAVNSSDWDISTGGNMTGIGSIAADGAIYGLVPVLTKDADYAVLAADSGAIIKNTAIVSATFTLPSAAAGLSYCFYNYAGTDVIVDPFDGVDTILKLTNSPGDSLTNTTQFDSVCLVALDATNWANLRTGIGTWADGD